MARVTEYNISFQEGRSLRSFLNIEKNKTPEPKRPPLLLPPLQPKKTSPEKTDGQALPDIGLDVRGLGGKNDEKFLDTRSSKKSKRRKTKVGAYGCFSPDNANKELDLKSVVSSLPSIDSKSLTSGSPSPRQGCSEGSTEMSQPEDFPLVYNLLMQAIEKGKVDQKRTSKRFQRSVVRGEQKPIIDKVTCKSPATP